ncbi:MAG: indole-3-glycerol-phosphate synthase [Candidatus Micrarchaeota archaeon]
MDEGIRHYYGGIIAEIKPASPSEGDLYSGSIEELAKIYEENGAGAISVLTNEKLFKGKLENVTIAKNATKLPILMKDFIVSREHVDAGKKAGADIILIILGTSPLELIDYTHSLGLQVLLETHTLEEFRQAKKTNADFIGINNRNLKTMEIDITNTIRILGKEKPDRMIVSESGIKTRHDIEILENAGVSGFLVGTSLLKSKDVGAKLRELLKNDSS